MISSGSSIKVCASRSRRRQTPLAFETYTALSSLRNFLTYLVSAATCSFLFPSNCSSNHRLWLEPSSSRCTDLSCLQVLSRKWSLWSSNNRNSLWVEGKDYLPSPFLRVFFFFFCLFIWSCSQFLFLVNIKKSGSWLIPPRWWCTPLSTCVSFHWY